MKLFSFPQAPLVFDRFLFLFLFLFFCHLALARQNKKKRKPSALQPIFYTRPPTEHQSRLFAVSRLHNITKCCIFFAVEISLISPSFVAFRFRTLLARFSWRWPGSRSTVPLHFEGSSGIMRQLKRYAI